MSWQRIAWLTTTAVCMITALILFLNGYQGYGVVLIAVGLAAAVNLT